MKGTLIEGDVNDRLAAAERRTRHRGQEADKARKKANKLSAKLSPECHAAIVGQVELAGGQVGCVQ